LGAALQADGENEVLGDGLKHQKEKRSMDHFGGLDVSVKETSICIVDDTGRIVKEVKVASEPAALLKVLGNPTYRFKRIGLEAGPLSQWLFSALAEAELPVVCVETRHMQAVLKAQINKTDRNDARGIAQMIRVGLFRPVHVKTLRSQKLRMLLTHRKLLQSKAIAIENDRAVDRCYSPERYQCEFATDYLEQYALMPLSMSERLFKAGLRRARVRRRKKMGFA
jgi:transposase